MKKITFFILLLICTTFSQSNSQSDFYPLREGNRWVYLSQGHRTEIIGGAVFVLPWYSPLVIEVVSDTVINSNTVWKHRYMSYTYNFANYDTNYIYEMYNPTGDSLYMGDFAHFSPWDDNLRFVFNSSVGESINVKLFDYRFMQETINLIHTSNSMENILGLNTNVMNFAFQDVSVKYSQKFCEGLGLIEQYGKATDNSWETRFTLEGCVIDGIVYGDTTLVVSVEDEQELPNQFSLSQNYPNPFNPSTKINFTIPSVRRSGTSPYNTKLLVYDILGREVKTLINKPMQPGSYEIEFDGSELPSGVYLYRITSGQFAQTKKDVVNKMRY